LLQELKEVSFSSRNKLQEFDMALKIKQFQSF
jgi:hypothetical protein